LLQAHARQFVIRQFWLIVLAVLFTSNLVAAQNKVLELEGTNGFVELSLRESSEPRLLEIEPGNSVACHLVSPPATVSESLTA